MNINNLIETKEQPVFIYLISGVKLKGKITEVGPDVIVFCSETTTQIIYKHAIATIMIDNSSED